MNVMVDGVSTLIFARDILRWRHHGLDMWGGTLKDSKVFTVKTTAERWHHFIGDTPEWVRP